MVVRFVKFRKVVSTAILLKAFRLPSINELFMNYPRGLLGDEQLRPEIVKTWDIGVSFQNDRMMGSTLVIILLMITRGVMQI